MNIRIIIKKDIKNEYFVSNNLFNFLSYNIGKYICLEMSLLWGIASIAFIYLLKPLMDKIIKYIPNIVIYILIFLILLDLITTLFLKLVFNKK